MCGSNCGDAGTKSACAEYSADLGIPGQLPALREAYGSAMHTGVHVRFFGDSGQCAIVPAKFVEEFDKSKQMRSANQRVARTSAVAEAHSVLHPQQRPRWR